MALNEAKFTPEALERAAQLRAGGLSYAKIRDHLLDEFNISLTLEGVCKALERAEAKRRREIAVKKAEIVEAELAAEAARSIAVKLAASDMGDDAKLIQLRLAALVGRSNAAWEGMSAKEHCSFKTWAKLEELTLKYLFLKLRLGGALQPEDADLDAARSSLRTKLDALVKKTAP